MNDGFKTVINCTNEEKTICVRGQYFRFKPGMEKIMRNEFADLIGQIKLQDGFIALPERFNDPEYAKSEAGEAEKRTLIEAGRERFIETLKARVVNSTVSLKKDLDQQNIKIDPMKLWSTQEKENLRLYKKYQDEKTAANTNDETELQDLLKQVDIG